MTMINKEKVLKGVGKAVDAANNAADKAAGFANQKEGLWIMKFLIKNMKNLVKKQLYQSRKKNLIKKQKTWLIHLKTE